MLLLELISKIKQNFPDIGWSIPAKSEHGILSTNFAFEWAKKNKINPAVYALDLSKELQSFADTHKLSIDFGTVGPYINIYPRPGYYKDFVNLDFTTQSISKTKVMLEYVGINVAKPIHAGHMRNMNIGESLLRLLKLKYSDLLTDNHWGDWGVQIGIVIWAIKQLKDLKTFEVEVGGQMVQIVSKKNLDYDMNEMVAIYVWGNQQESSVERWKEMVRDEFLKLEKGDAQNFAIWQILVNRSMELALEVFKQWNISKHDLNQGESFYENDMRLITAYLENNKLWKKEGQARYFDLEELLDKWNNIPKTLQLKIKNFGRCYLISSQGYTTYTYRDIAARIQWARDYDRKKMITLTDFTQTHNFDQAFAITAYLTSLTDFAKHFGIVDKIDWNELIHIPYGFLKLKEGKMSSRKGNFLSISHIYDLVYTKAMEIIQQKESTISDLELDKRAHGVTIAAVKWYDLSKDSIHDIILDIDQILSFEGNTGVYQLYTLVRLNSILQKCQDIQFSMTDFEPKYLNLLELDILQSIYQTQITIQNSINDYKPHYLVNQLYEIASKINSWYAKNSIKEEADINRQKTLLVFCKTLINNQQKFLNLLAIDSLTSL